jgi:hypothetical protein
MVRGERLPESPLLNSGELIGHLLGTPFLTGLGRGAVLIAAPPRTLGRKARRRSPVVKPERVRHRRTEKKDSSPSGSEDPMRNMGALLLTGAAAIVLWKVFAALFMGLLGMALKVALVVGVVYLMIQFFKKKDEEPEEA